MGRKKFCLSLGKDNPNSKKAKKKREQSRLRSQKYKANLKNDPEKHKQKTEILKKSS